LGSGAAGAVDFAFLSEEHPDALMARFEAGSCTLGAGDALAPAANTCRLRG